MRAAALQMSIWLPDTFLPTCQAPSGVPGTSVRLFVQFVKFLASHTFGAPEAAGPQERDCGRTADGGCKRKEAGMEERAFQRRESPLLRISEDWWAVILALLLIALVLSGVLSPVPW